MWLVVLRSLAVYGGTAALFLFLAHRWIVPVRFRVGLLLALAPLLFTGRAMLTGGVFAPIDIAYQAEPLLSHRKEMEIGPTKNPLLVDVVSQMIPWRKAVREAFAEGRLPLWNPYLLAGEPLLAVQQPAVLHPGTWIGFLLPLPQAWTFDMTLRMLLALACAYLFFRGMRASELGSLLGAAAWAFSDFLIFFVGYPVTPSVAPFPLLLLGLSRLAEKADRRAVGVTVTALVLMVVAGHPETLLFAVTGGGIYFLFELWEAPRGRRLRAVLLSILAGTLALGLTAVVLLPFLEVVPQTWHYALRHMFYAKGERSEALLEGLRRMVPTFVPYAWGTLGKSGIVGRLILPAGYAGSILFPLAAAGLTARTRRKWCLLALGLFGLALNARLPGLTDLLTSLPLFDIAICDYFVFLWVFALAALAVLGADRLREGYGVPAFLAGGLAATMAIVVAAGIRSRGLRVDLGMSPAYLGSRLLMQVLPLLAALLLVLFCARRRRFGAAPLAALLALLVLQRGLEERDVYPTYPVKTFYPRLALFDGIPRGEPARFASLRSTFAPNIGAMYGLEDVRGYEAMSFGPLAETYGLWCVQLPAFFNRVDDARTPFLSFLNVRYVLAGPHYPELPGWKLIGEERGSRIFENPNVLPRAFAPRHIAWTDNPRLHLWAMQRIGDFGRDGVAGRERPGRLGWSDNGEAEVRISSYAPERLALSIEAKSEAFIGTSIPGWHGWKLALDGKRAPLISFNRAFLGFEVPAGRHEAVLRYLPDGFVWGAAISLASVLACVWLARRKTLART